MRESVQVVRVQPIAQVSFFIRSIRALSILGISAIAGLDLAGQSKDRGQTTVPVKPPPKAVDPSVEVEFWKSIRDSKDPADFEAYLEKFPKGQFAPLARNRLKALGGSAEPAPRAGRPAAGAPAARPEPRIAAVKAPPTPGETWQDPVSGITFCWIPAGRFSMGSPVGEPGRVDWEGPQHEVTIAQGFWLGRTEVTQAQWRAQMGNNPSHFQNAGPDAPVETVNWEDAQGFCRTLSGKGGRRYRLPTEAEWEYACRADSKTALYTGPLTIRGQNDGPELDPIAWYGGNSGVEYAGGFDSSGWKEKQFPHTQAGTHPVASKRANAWGLHDMLGNVWEWCEDTWHDNYSGAPSDGSAWTSGGDSTRRVLRGGSWYFVTGHCRSAGRLRIDPTSRFDLIGFRVVVDAPSRTP